MPARGNGVLERLKNCNSLRLVELKKTGVSLCSSAAWYIVISYDEFSPQIVTVGSGFVFDVGVDGFYMEPTSTREPTTALFGALVRN